MIAPKKIDGLEGVKRSCIRYKETWARSGGSASPRRALRCAEYAPTDAVGREPCSPEDLVDGPLGRSPGIIRSEETICLPTAAPRFAPPGLRTGHPHQPVDVADPRLVGHGRRSPRRRRRNPRG